MSHELSHELVVNREAWYIRFYLWLYAANPNRINTCKLFWAYVLSPVVLPLLGLGRLIVALILLLPKSGKPAPVKPIRTGPSRTERTLDSVATNASSFWAKHQRALKVLGFIVVTAYAGFIIIGIILAIIKSPLTALIVVGSGLAVADLIVGIIWFFKSRPGDNFVKLFGRLFRSVHDHTCVNVKVA